MNRRAMLSGLGAATALAVVPQTSVRAEAVNWRPEESAARVIALDPETRMRLVKMMRDHPDFSPSWIRLTEAIAALDEPSSPLRRLDAVRRKPRM